MDISPEIAPNPFGITKVSSLFQNNGNFGFLSTKDGFAEEEEKKKESHLKRRKKMRSLFSQHSIQKTVSVGLGSSFSGRGSVARVRKPM